MSHTINNERRSNRLKGYDYSQPGGYFVTICTMNKTNNLGNVEDGRVILSFTGKTVEACWLGIPKHFPDLFLDEWVIMPNHMHGIIFILDAGRGEAFAEDPNQMMRRTANASPLRHPKGTTPSSLGAIIQNFKSISTRKVNQLHDTPGNPLWQRGFYDRVIRNEKELDRIRRYIAENPLKWVLDPYHI